MQWTILLFSFFYISTLSGQTYYSGAGGSAFAWHSCILYKKFTPKDITSLAQLPDSTRKNLEFILKAHLTEDFYKKIRLTEAREMNPEEMTTACPEIKNYQWKVPKYDMRFSFSDSAHQIGSYSFLIKVNANGDIVDYQGKKEDVPITDFSKEQNIKFVTPDIAEKIAKKYNNRQKYVVGLNFYKKRIAWKITTEHKDKDGRIFIQEVQVDAHNGNLLAVDKTYPLISYN